MPSLKDIPGIGFFKRRKLQREGYELVYTESGFVTAYENDTRTTSDIYPPGVQAIIAKYGDNVKVITSRSAIGVPNFYPHRGYTFDCTFYALAKRSSR